MVCDFTIPAAHSHFLEHLYLYVYEKEWDHIKEGIWFWLENIPIYNCFLLFITLDGPNILWGLLCKLNCKIWFYLSVCFNIQPKKSK